MSDVPAECYSAPGDSFVRDCDASVSSDLDSDPPPPPHRSPPTSAVMEMPQGRGGAVNRSGVVSCSTPALLQLATGRTLLITGDRQGVDTNPLTLPKE